MPKGQFRGLRSGGKKNTSTSFVRTKVRTKSDKPNFPLRKRVNGRNRTLTHIASGKNKAQKLAKSERKKGKNATIVSRKKLHQGPRTVITSGLKLGTHAVFTEPKTKKSRKSKRRKK